MKSFSHRLPVLGALAASAFLSAPIRAQTTPVAPVAAPIAGPAGVAATVNNDRILSADLDRATNALKADYPALAANTEGTRTQIAQFRRDLLEKLINLRLVQQEAARLKISIAPDDLKAALTQYKVANNIKDDAELTAQLAKEGKTIANLRALLSAGLAGEKLTQTWIADVTVSDADIVKFYADNPDLFVEPESARARHILIAVKAGATAAERAQALARANQVFKQAQGKNADFAKLVKDNSQDAQSREAGGVVATFWLNYKAIEDAIFATPQGKVTGPIESDFGYHIIRVDAKTPARKRALSEVRGDPALKAAVLIDKRQKRIAARMTALRASAKIQKFV